MARYFSCLRVHRIFSNKRSGAYIKFRLKGGGGGGALIWRRTLDEGSAY